MTTQTSSPNGAHYLKVAVQAAVCLMLLCIVPAHAQTDWPRMAKSQDGTPISYQVYGAGEPTLTFVHGWSCDSRYWQRQIPYFSRNHRVIVLDLAGHGHSGQGRARYTMQSFGEDVRAVIAAEKVSSTILIGHSMGGSVIAEAARLMPEHVSGLIGIDTLENVEYPMTSSEMEQFVKPLEADFPSGCRAFVSTMLRDKSDPALREWILADMAAAPPQVAMSAMREMMSLYVSGAAARVFDGLNVPVVTVNADMWPINFAANRRHMHSYDAIIIKNADHFLMLNRSDEFNPALEKAVGMIQRAAVRPTN